MDVFIVTLVSGFPATAYCVRKLPIGSCPNEKTKNKRKKRTVQNKLSERKIRRRVWPS
jgi:hypothetical protein